MTGFGSEGFTHLREAGWGYVRQRGYCYSHAFQETNSLRRTMQIVKCSLLYQQTQDRVSS